MRVRGQTLDVEPEAWSEMLTEELRDLLRQQAGSWEAHGLTAVFGLVVGGGGWTSTGTGARTGAGAGAGAALRPAGSGFA